MFMTTVLRGLFLVAFFILIVQAGQLSLAIFQAVQWGLPDAKVGVIIAFKVIIALASVLALKVVGKALERRATAARQADADARRAHAAEGRDGS